MRRDLDDDADKGAMSQDDGGANGDCYDDDKIGMPIAL